MSQPAELADRFLFCQFCLWSIIFSKLHLTVERGNCLSVPHISQEPFVQSASLLAGLLQSTLGSAVLDVVAIWTGDMFNVNTSEINTAMCGSEGSVSAHWPHGSEDSTRDPSHIISWGRRHKQMVIGMVQ